MQPPASGETDLMRNLVRNVNPIGNSFQKRVRTTPFTTLCSKVNLNASKGTVDRPRHARSLSAVLTVVPRC